MSTYLESLTDEELCKILIEDGLLNQGIVKEAAKRLRLYSHILSHKPIDEHLRDLELQEKLKDMKHELLPIPR